MIPEIIELKIYDKYPNPEGLSDILFDTRKINAAKRSGATFGYSLAQEEIERLKAIIWKMYDGGDYPDSCTQFKSENNL